MFAPSVFLLSSAPTLTPPPSAQYVPLGFIINANDKWKISTFQKLLCLASFLTDFWFLRQQGCSPYHTCNTPNASKSLPLQSALNEDNRWNTLSLQEWPSLATLLTNSWFQLRCTVCLPTTTRQAPKISPLQRKMNEKWCTVQILTIQGL